MGKSKNVKYLLNGLSVSEADEKLGVWALKFSVCRYRSCLIDGIQFGGSFGTLCKFLM